MVEASRLCMMVFSGCELWALAPETPSFIHEVLPNADQGGLTWPASPFACFLVLFLGEATCRRTTTMGPSESLALGR
jgi:hypothetical protein